MNPHVRRFLAWLRVVPPPPPSLTRVRLPEARPAAPVSRPPSDQQRALARWQEEVAHKLMSAGADDESLARLLADVQTIGHYEGAHDAA